MNEAETLPKDALYERWEETTISQLRAATDSWTDHHRLSWDSRVDATAQGQEAGSYNKTFNVYRFTLEIPQPVNSMHNQLEKQKCQQWFLTDNL